MQYTSSETPFLPVRNNLQSNNAHTHHQPTSLRNAAGAGGGNSTMMSGGHPLHSLGLGHNNTGHHSMGTLGGGPASTLRNARFSEKNLALKKCSWRCVAIFFVVLALILSAALAYITGKKLEDPLFLCRCRQILPLNREPHL